MAREPENEEVQQSETAVEKRGFPLKWLILGAFVLLLGGGALFSWQSGLFAQFSGNSIEDFGTKITKKKGVVDIGPMYALEPFVVNLNEPLGKRYLKAKLELELAKESTRFEIDRRLPQFRDAVLTLLSGKEFEEISDLTGKYQLRMEILSVLNSLLTTGRIQNLYFTEFIVQ
jgi:flagellar protein FliL